LLRFGYGIAADEIIYFLREVDLGEIGLDSFNHGYGHVVWTHMAELSPRSFSDGGAITRHKVRFWHTTKVGENSHQPSTSYPNPLLDFLATFSPSLGV
jgi:hypothetical protein